MKPTRVWLLVVPGVLVIAGLMAWRLWPEPDPVFHGKRESEWIDEARYMNVPLPDKFVAQWRDFGPEGVEVLIRGLDRELGKANNPWIRLHRRIHGRIGPHVPFLSDSPDLRVPVRTTLIELLRYLDADVALVTPSIARALNDHSVHVRLMAVLFLVDTGLENAPLNQLPPRQKRKLLPGLLRAFEAGRSLRPPVALALGFYAEEADIVVPMLVSGLRDLDPEVRVFAALALNRVDAAAARNAGAVSVTLDALDQPNPHLALSAVWALREFETESDVIIPALLDALAGTIDMIGAAMIRSIEHFAQARPDLVIPALQQAAQREDEVGMHAAAALERLESDVGSTTEQP